MNKLIDIEPLKDLATFSFDWAHALCNSDIGCFSYHRAWSIIRYIERDGSLPAGIDFFSSALQSLSENDGRRVLISGAADTGVLALVLSAYRSFGAEPQVVLVDRCDTTIQQNFLLARRAGIDFQVHKTDIKDTVCSPVDAVIAHSFLIFFEPDLRSQVLGSWARLLSPIGRVLISEAFAVPGREAAVVQNHAEAVEARRLKLRKSALQKGYSDKQAEEISLAASDFWNRRDLFNKRRWTLDEFLSAVAEQGLEVDVLNETHPTNILNVSSNTILYQISLKRAGA